MAKSQVSPKEINWQSDEPIFLHNPNLPDKDKEMLSSLRRDLPNISSAIWILTSGSTTLNQYKWIALTRKAFLCSAEAVNEHIKSTADDIWMNVLPIFHVGGLSVWARAHLSGAKVIEHNGGWDPHKFVHALESKKITLTSLVPSQVFDLVHLNLKCPPNLRAVFVGGGALSESIYFKARELGYPVLSTYGMTETCSQIATASLESLTEHRFPDAHVLQHLEIKKGPEDVLEVKGGSLLSGLAIIENGKIRFEEHSANSWYPTGDIGDIQSGCVKVRGRKSELVKVLGELVSFPKLRSVLELLSSDQAATLIPVPDTRKGHSVAMVLELTSLQRGDVELVRAYNESVAPFEKATQVYFVEKIPTSPLGKLKTGELKEQIGVL